MGMLLVLPVIVLVLALTHHSWIKDALDCYGKEETCKAFAIPVTSTLHGVRSPRLPNVYLNWTSVDGKSSDDMYVLNIVTEPITTLRDKVFGLFTKSIAGKPFVKSADATMQHFNTNPNGDLAVRMGCKRKLQNVLVVVCGSHAIHNGCVDFCLRTEHQNLYRR